MPHADRFPEDVSRTLERVRKAERLSSDAEAFGFLVHEYEFFPEGYPGGYSQLLLDYASHIQGLSRGLEESRIGLTQFMQDGFPNNFLYRKGVRHVVGLRQAYGDFASHKLDPIDGRFRRAFADGMANWVSSRVPRRPVGELVDAVEPIADYVSALNAVWGPMDFSFPEILREVSESRNGFDSELEREAFGALLKEQ